MDDLISRHAAIDALNLEYRCGSIISQCGIEDAIDIISELPSAQPKYEPVKAEDFAKTMSENTIYGFTVWYGTVLELIERQGFAICKKTM